MKTRDIGIILILAFTLLLQGCAGSLPPLHEAARDGDITRIRTLIAAGEKIDSRYYGEQTPLKYAGVNGNSEAVKELLSNGANPNAKDCLGKTPVFHTCYIDSMKMLLDAGAKVGWRDRKGQTPLHEAIRCKGAKGNVAELLLNYGADVNASDIFGISVLHLSMRYADLSTIKTLLDNGAEVNPVNVDGLTPRDMACVMDREDVVKLLDEYGGKSKRYSSKVMGNVKIYKGTYDNPGSNYLKSTFEAPAGFIRFNYPIEWVGSPGSLGFGLAYRRIHYLSGYFFGEPGHSYTIDTYAGDSPWGAYSLVTDRDTKNQVGLFLIK